MNNLIYKPGDTYLICNQLKMHPRSHINRYLWAKLHLQKQRRGIFLYASHLPHAQRLRQEHRALGTQRVSVMRTAACGASGSSPVEMPPKESFPVLPEAGLVSPEQCPANTHSFHHSGTQNRSCLEILPLQSGT